MSKATYDPTEGLRQAWGATNNVLELDEAGFYQHPLSEVVKQMLERHASELYAEFIALGGCIMCGEVVGVITSVGVAPLATKRCPFRLDCAAVRDEVEMILDYGKENTEASIVLVRMLCEAKGERYDHENLNRYRNMAIAEVRGIPFDSMKWE